MPNRSDQEPIKGTKLSPKEEIAYQKWRSALPKPLQYEGDYDLRGLYKANPNSKPSPNLHFPDTFKLPNHPTFSNESIYFNPATKNSAGRWQETDSSFNYIPFNPAVKDTVIEMKGKPFTVSGANEGPPTNGKPASTEKEVAKWWSEYVESPKYKERLSAFYKYPDYVQRQRSGVINSISFRENPGTSSAYYDNGNEVAMSDLQAKALGSSRQEIAAHEMGHAVNANRRVRGAALSPKEEGFILERNKQLSQGSLQRFQAMSKETGKPVTALLTGELHDVDPSENLSDVQSLRFMLKQRKLYDAGTQDITPEIIKKAANDPVIRKSFIWKRIKESFGEKELLEIMNKVATGKSSKKSNIA